MDNALGGQSELNLLQVRCAQVKWKLNLCVYKM